MYSHSTCSMSTQHQLHLHTPLTPLCSSSQWTHSAPTLLSCSNKAAAAPPPWLHSNSVTDVTEELTAACSTSGAGRLERWGIHLAHTFIKILTLGTGPGNMGTSWKCKWHMLRRVDSRQWPKVSDFVARFGNTCESRSGMAVCFLTCATCKKVSTA